MKTGAADADTASMLFGGHSCHDGHLLYLILHDPPMKLCQVWMHTTVSHWYQPDKAILILESLNKLYNSLKLSSYILSLCFCQWCVTLQAQETAYKQGWEHSWYWCLTTVERGFSKQHLVYLWKYICFCLLAKHVKGVGLWLIQRLSFFIHFAKPFILIGVAGCWRLSQCSMGIRRGITLDRNIHT